MLTVLQTIVERNVETYLKLADFLDKSLNGAIHSYLSPPEGKKTP